MIDTLLFDLDNTLLDFDKAEANALSKALHDVNIKVDDLMLIRYNKINSSQWKLLEKGIITREEIKLRRFKILFEEFSLNADPKEVARNYQEYLGQGHYFIKDAEEVLEQLSKTHRIYLVTNGTLSVQKGRIESSGIKKYLQGVFISEEVGYNKDRSDHSCIIFLIYHYWNDCAICTYEDGKQRKDFMERFIRHMLSFQTICMMESQKLKNR